MAFIFQGNIATGATESRISWEAAASLTTAAGALVTKAPAAASIAAKANTTTEHIFGINKKLLSASDTVAQVENTPNGTLLLADVDEILNGTVITAASGSATTVVATNLIGLGTNDALKGAQFTVKTKAADSTQVGKVLTITGYTTATGTLTFATTTSAFATGDTLTLTNLGIPTTKVWYDATSSLNSTAYNRPYVSNPYIVGLTTLALNSAATAVTIQVSNTPMSFFRVLGTDATGTKLLLIVLDGIDSTKVLATT